MSIGWILGRKVVVFFGSRQLQQNSSTRYREMHCKTEKWGLWSLWHYYHSAAICKILCCLVTVNFHNACCFLYIFSSLSFLKLILLSLCSFLEYATLVCWFSLWLSLSACVIMARSQIIWASVNLSLKQSKKVII